MQDVYNISHSLCILLAGWAAVNWLLLIYLMIRQIQMKSHRILYFLVPAAIVQWFFYQSSIYWQVDKRPLAGKMIAGIPEIVNRVPVQVIFLIQLGLTGVTVLAGWVIIPWIRSHVTNHAIKEGIDEMQTGFCRYYPDGVVALKNRQMDRLAVLLTGSQLMNGVQFENTVKKLDFGKTLSVAPEESYLIAADEEIWEFSIKKKDDPKTPSEMTARNITAEYVNTRSLMEKRTELEEINKRLSAYYQQVVNTVTSQEILSVKARIHDDLGIALLTAKQYLLNPESADRNEVSRLLKEKVDLICEDAPDQELLDEYELMFDTAERVQVTILLEGELPQKEPAKHLIAMAIHECTTNTIRHAGGDTIRIKVQKKDKMMLTVLFTNNGEQPVSPVIPKGGLLHLQEMSEQMGCRMEITSQPEFRLQFWIPATT